MSRSFNDITLTVLMSLCCWVALSFGITAVVQDNWVVFPLTDRTYGLWKYCGIIPGQCIRIGDHLISPSTQIVRSTTITGCVFTFVGGIFMIYSQCKCHAPARKTASIFFFIAGSVGLIGMIVFTVIEAIYRRQPYYHGSGLILGYVGYVLALCAGIFAILTYSGMKKEN